MRPLRGKTVGHTELSNLDRTTSLSDSEFTYIKEKIIVESHDRLAPDADVDI